MLYWPVGLVAMAGVPWELEDNFQRMEAYVREAVRRHAKIVIAPEGVLDGYVCMTDAHVTKGRMMAVAQSVHDGPYLQRGSQLSRELGIYLVFGFLERAGDELFNSIVMFDPQGQIIAKFSKIHPTTESHITPGRELKTFDTPLGRLGFLICCDRHVVDSFSTLGVQGAEIIIIPMNGSGGPTNTATLRQRARDNGCFIVIANTWSSVIINPAGEIILEKYESECVGIGHVYPFEIPKGDQRYTFMQRRIDLYSPLMKCFESDDVRHFDDQGRPTEYEEKRRAEWREKLPELDIKP